MYQVSFVGTVSQNIPVIQGGGHEDNSREGDTEILKGGSEPRRPDASVAFSEKKNRGAPSAMPGEVHADYISHDPNILLDTPELLGFPGLFRGDAVSRSQGIEKDEICFGEQCPGVLSHFVGGSRHGVLGLRHGTPYGSEGSHMEPYGGGSRTSVKDKGKGAESVLSTLAGGIFLCQSVSYVENGAEFFLFSLLIDGDIARCGIIRDL